ncbi:N-acyl-L-amino acid amidohydrolase [Arthrobacter sp. YC-RL1]|uniref:amidohydrolase n=1 Tax=unclassified Arthrobacter TaxID=235627 RepID=UPI00063D9650|nr:amidohydrolase [Arthrobacter sp. YC-RL1]ALQ31636.1 N-acyl-L-amino acid amidohydrolase [Arthrobacter sp. YC-RL1]KLI89894.1 N-acyl-L-amino acid amidohydrolase [Arthrobacter sp. YC-RL1]
MSELGNLGSVKDWTESLTPELIEFRRELHRNPELSFAEFQTTERILEALRSAGLNPVKMERTGAYVDVGEGPIRLALRADIDALPVLEETELDYASTIEGIAHACGHDIHTTVMLGTALALGRIQQAGQLAGRIRVIFQPAEEKLPGGAVSVIEQGILDEVPRILALHCEPRIDAGKIGTRIGAITSASDTIRIEVNGRGGHTSRPHLTEDIVFAMSQIATQVPAVLGRKVDVRSAVSVVWGQIHAGSAPNAIPATGYLAGTMRCLDGDVWYEAGELLDAAVRQIAAPYGVEIKLQHTRGVPPVVNAPAETALIESAARQEFGTDSIELTPQSMGGEDFAWMTQKVPGAMLRLGTRTPGGKIFDLHRGDYVPDERCIAVGVRIMCAAALQAIDAANGIRAK